MDDVNINFPAIEKKWQIAWEKNKIFHVREGKKKKFYVLEMFPYPSGSGLHMGHAFNYTVGDIYARFKRMQGFNVLYPMGYDSFGLPAENAAIEAKIHPKVFTEKAINNFIRQQKNLGLSYDWSRIIKTSDPEYYKWNQYFFLKFFKQGLVYRKEAVVNWCPSCNTVLANEQVHQGKCWRHNKVDVVEKRLEQWFIQTTKYTKELLNAINKLQWPERIKLMQVNWIGESKGTLVKFKLKNSNDDIEVFTTRPDTLYGVTFLVYSIHHPKVKELIKGSKEGKKVLAFLKNIPKQSPEDKNKEGVFLGIYSIHPLTRVEIPIYASNFVVEDYAKGVVMGVPAHDQRDFEFAKKYKIPVKIVIQNKDRSLNIASLNKAYADPGILVNSGQFSGMDSQQAIPKITRFLKQKKLGKENLQYKLKDWLVSRQRYWGTPIPIIYCKECGIVPVPEKDLPVLLPDKVEFSKGNPLTTNKNFVNAKCPKCGKPARRETDTMDTFFDSSWYYLRYTDNKNSKFPFDADRAKYWMPVDQYIGGAEHACMHLIYARFFNKVLRDMNMVKVDEPFSRLFNQGMLHKDGFVMSKSRGNVIMPETVSERYGIDTARLFLVSIASPDRDTEWSDQGIESSLRFIKKIYDHCINVKIGKSSKKIESKLNKLIKLITEDIENFRYNSAVIKIREFVDDLEEEISRKDLESFIKTLSPFCPHLAEELWHKLGNKNFVSIESWPSYDNKKIDEKYDKIDEMIDRVVADVINIIDIIKKEGKEAKVVYFYVIPKEIENYDINILMKRINKDVKVYAVNDKNIYDPVNKARKAKPGRPAIYVE